MVQQSFYLGVLTLRTNSVVTIWHFDDSDTPKRRVFKNVHLDFTHRIDKNGIKQKGFFCADSAIVRIPTVEEIDAVPGDYICIGESLDEFPLADGSLKIVEVKDNRRGGQKHCRISCGG